MHWQVCDPIHRRHTLYLVAPLKIISGRHTSSYELTNASLLWILSSFWTTSLHPMELGLTKGIYKLLLYSWPQPKLKRFVPSLAYVTTIHDLSRTIRFLLDRYSNYWRKKLYFTGISAWPNWQTSPVGLDPAGIWLHYSIPPRKRPQ